MITRLTRAMPTVLSAILAMVLALNPAGAGASDIALAITGAPGTQFQADCTLFRPGGVQVSLSFGGAVPVSRTLQVQGLSCTIVQTSPTGHLDIELRRGNSVQRTAAGGYGSISRLTVR